MFLAAVVFFSYLTNNGNDSMTADMGAATYPQISFSYDGYSLNSVPGFAREMDIPSIRDTITPVGPRGVEMDIQAHDNGISSVDYKVYSLDGQEVLQEETIRKPGETQTLDLAGVSEESVLQVILHLEGGKDIFYYTRIAPAGDKNLSQCLNYIQNFHEAALNGGEGAAISTAIEPSDEGDNTTFSHVTIHSDYNHVTWGELNPRVEGGERWSIKEMRGTYSCVQLEYTVRCQGEENEDDLYKVTEFFRVRYDKERDHTYLLDYDRRMEQIFDPTRQILSASGILLGIADHDVPYVINEDGTIVSFIQAGEVWNYNRNTDEISQVFSFSSAENTDERNATAQHEIRLIQGDKAGDLTFAVYGYMNRGPHEGEVGVAVYYYDIATSSVEEKVFISTDKSWASTILELGRLVYYNVEEDLLYILVDQTLYEIDVERDERNALAEGLTEDQYVVSDDGHMIAYQGEGQIVVRNLSSGKERQVEAAKGEAIRPLGFIHGDFIFGRFDPEDAGVMSAGEEISPMYEIEIRNDKGDTEARYSFTDQNIYTTDILIRDNQITLNRVSGENGQYHAVEQEYITNNQERDDRTVALETYYTDEGETQTMLGFGEGLPDLKPEFIKPGQIVSGEPLTVTISGSSEKEEFYVYGMGELLDIYDRAGYAVQRASEISAVVISSEQAYVWESGNRDLSYSAEADAFRREGEETSLEACERYMEQYGAHQIDLTGCTLDQMLYVINRGCPMITLTGADHAVLLTGYTTTDITYIDPDSGEIHTVSQKVMQEMTEAAGNVFIGYIR